jgi:hypothetical protein
MVAPCQKEDFFPVKTGVFSTVLGRRGVLWWLVVGEGAFFMHNPRPLVMRSVWDNRDLCALFVLSAQGWVGVSHENEPVLGCLCGHSPCVT